MTLTPSDVYVHPLQLRIALQGEEENPWRG